MLLGFTRWTQPCRHHVRVCWEFLQRFPNDCFVSLIALHLHDEYITVPLPNAKDQSPFLQQWDCNFPGTRRARMCSAMPEVLVFL